MKEDFFGNLKNYTIIALFGGSLYCVLELIWRGRTHPSMALCGGLCFLFIYLINDNLRGASIIKQGLISCIFITIVELCCGFIVNICMGLDVWDYSAISYNLLGQICLPFSIIWFLISIPCIYISRVFKKCLE